MVKITQNKNEVKIVKKCDKNKDKYKDKRFVRFGPSGYDPNGAYTGVPEDFGRQVQDADDL